MALTRITKGVIKPNENYQAGIVTATGLDVNGNGDISGDLNVGGILTYEDVTSIDSVGIITAQKGIHVGAGVSAVGVGTFGSLDISGDIDVDGHTNLDNVNVAGVTTFASGTVFTGAIDANGDLDVDGHTNLDNISVAGVTTFAGAITANGAIDLNADLDVDGHTNLDNVSISGVTTSGHLTINGDLTVNDNYPSIYLKDYDSDSDFMLQNQNGTFTVYDVTNNADRFEITSTGTVRSPHYTLQSQSPSLTFNDTNHDSDYMWQNANGLFKIYDNTNFADRFAVNSSGSVFVYGDELYIGDSIIHNGDIDTKIRFPANDSISFETGGTERLRIHSDGKMSLGTSSSASAKFNISHGNELALYTSGPYNYQAKFESTDAEAAIVIEDVNSGSNYNRIGVITNDMTFITNNNERFRIDQYGNAGLGVAPRTAAGGVNNDTDVFLAIGDNDTGIAQDGDGQFEIWANNQEIANFNAASVTLTKDLYIPDKLRHDGDSDTQIRFPAADTFSVETAGSERLRITSAGDVGIGTAIPVVANGYGNLSLAGNTGGQLELKRVSDDIRHYIWGNQYLNIGGGYTNGSSSAIIFRVNGATERLRITSSGQVGIGTDAPAGGSSLHINGGGASDKPHIRLTADRGLIARLGDTSGGAQAMFDLYDPSDGSTQIVRFISGGGVNYINTGGNFGVGHDSPDRTLHVKSGANNNNGAFRIESAPGNIMDMGTDGSCHFLNCVNNDPFRIKFAGNEALRVTQETSGNWSTTLQFYMETANSQGATPYIKGVAGTEAGGTDANNTGGLEFHTKTGGSGTDINAMRIDHNGRVSIGAHNIQNPTAALHVIGDTQGTNVAFQVGADASARYLRVNEISGQSNFGDLTLSFYDNTLPSLLKLQNTYANAANMGTAIQFNGHGGSQTGKISVYNRDANTASNSVMELNASYVTKPNQPSFAAYKSQSVWTVSGTMVFGSTKHNTGNHYSTSNGRFTAPVAGSYQFNFYSIYRGNHTSGWVSLYKNNARMTGGDIHFTYYDLGNNWDNVSFSQVIYLSQGDYVEMKSAQSTDWHGNNWQLFSGYLLG